MEMKVMGKGINIKVSKEKLLIALEEKLSEVHSNQALYEAGVETHKDNWKNYEEAIKKIALKNLDSVTDVTPARWQNDDNFTVFEITVKVDNTKLPTEPKEPTPPYKGGRGYGKNYVSNDYDDIVADLTNAIRMLKLSDEDVVSTATYASVSRYL
jgi:hypothetical protein